METEDTRKIAFPIRTAALHDAPFAPAPLTGAVAGGLGKGGNPVSGFDQNPVAVGTTFVMGPHEVRQAGGLAAVALAEFTAAHPL